MQSVILKVDGMSCEHCVKAVSSTVGALDGVSKVVVDLATKSVEVEFDPARVSQEKIESAIEDQGYDVIR